MIDLGKNLTFRSAIHKINQEFNIVYVKYKMKLSDPKKIKSKLVRWLYEKEILEMRYLSLEWWKNIWFSPYKEVLQVIIDSKIFLIFSNKKNALLELRKLYKVTFKL